MARMPIHQWLHDAMTDVGHETPCTAVSLMHMTGIQADELKTVRFGGAKAWDAKELYEMLRNIADTYAQELIGVQTFQILVHYGIEAKAKMPMLITGKLGESDGLSTENPTPQGQVQQLMRQSEMVFQQCMRQTNVLNEHALRMVESLGNQNVRLQMENQEAYTLMREIFMKQAEENHNQRMSELQFERASTERKKWLAFAPPLINTLLGREVFPQGTEDTALIEGLCDSLSDEDITKVAAILKPEMLGPIMSRVQKHAAKKNQEKEALERAKQLAPPVNPLADVNGGS